MRPKTVERRLEGTFANNRINVTRKYKAPNHSDVKTMKQATFKSSNKVRSRWHSRRERVWRGRGRGRRVSCDYNMPGRANSGTSFARRLNPPLRRAEAEGEGRDRGALAPNRIISNQSFQLSCRNDLSSQVVVESPDFVDNNSVLLFFLLPDGRRKRRPHLGCAQIGRSGSGRRGGLNQGLLVWYLFARRQC
jgi:hypothetical protein